MGHEARGSNPHDVRRDRDLLDRAGQTLLWEYVSPNAAVTPDILYGFSIFMPGDLNFDGVSDVLVSCQSSPNGAQTNAGYVGVLSGVDGTPIYELHGIGGGRLWAPCSDAQDSPATSMATARRITGSHTRPLPASDS